MDTPNVPFSWFLYNCFKDLTIAPKEIRTLTEHVLGNIMKTGVLLGCFSLSSIFSYNTNASGYLGLFFIVSTCWLVIKPLIKNRFNEININLISFWQLIILSIIFMNKISQDLLTRFISF